MTNHRSLQRRTSKTRPRNRKKRSSVISGILFDCLALTIIFGLGGCDNSFNPKTEFKEELTVFCVLDNTQDVQIVRLGTTYDAELGNVGASTGRTIESASVTIWQGGDEYIFEPEVVKLNDSTSELMWVNRELIPEQNKQYRLEVGVEGFPQAKSTLILPSAAQTHIRITESNSSVQSVTVYSGATDYEQDPKGFMIRLIFEFEDTQNGEPILKRAEVPIGEQPLTGEPVYPVAGRENKQIYTRYYLQKTLYSLTQDMGKFKLVKAIASIHTIDPGFYNYYKVVRGFDDPRTVRLDKPDYTNIEGARGIFGGIYMDSEIKNIYKTYRP